MKRWSRFLSAVAVVAAAATLAGCASPVIRSEVTAFHEWRPELRGKPFVFERSTVQNDNLEYRSYENLVRGELQKLGFAEASASQKPALTVRLDYALRPHDVRVVQPVMVPDPFFYPMYGPRWRRHYSPFYDPFWAHNSIQYVEGHQVVYYRQLHVTMADAAKGTKVYDVTVNSQGRNPSLAAVMPYMVSSAFNGFPGNSGVPRRVDMEVKEELPAQVNK